jgi:hypothetical protein
MEVYDMTDSAKPSDGQANNATANGLDARLGRRGTEPPGVIDVRYAQEKYFRIVRWLDKGSALLDHLKSRYGVEEALATGEHPLAIAQPLNQQAHLFSTTTQLFSNSQSFSPAAPSAPSRLPQQQTAWEARPSGLAEVIAEHSAKSDDESAAGTEREFRISRRPPPMLPDSNTTSQISPGDGSVPTTKSPWRDADTSENPNPTVRPEAPPDFIFRKIAEESSGRKPADVAKSTSVTEKPADGSERKEQIGTALSFAQREDRETADASQASSLPLVKPHAAPPRVEPFPEWQSVEVARRAQAGDVEAPQYRSHSLDSSVNRRTVVTPETPSPIEPMTKLPYAAPPLVASEIRDPAPPVERPDIVWRQPPGDRQNPQETALSVPAGAAQARYSEATAAAPASQQTGLATKVQTPGQMIQTQGSEGGVEHFSPQAIRSISERVIRAITLDLKLERERRGETKWR